MQASNHKNDLNQSAWHVEQTWAEKKKKNGKVTLWSLKEKYAQNNTSTLWPAYNVSAYKENVQLTSNDCLKLGKMNKFNKDRYAGVKNVIIKATSVKSKVEESNYIKLKRRYLEKSFIMPELVKEIS